MVRRKPGTRRKPGVRHKTGARLHADEARRTEGNWIGVARHLSAENRQALPGSQCPANAPFLPNCIVGSRRSKQAIATVAEATTVDEPSRWCRGGIMTRMKATALAITVSTLLACQHSPAPTAPTEPVAAGRLTAAPAENAGVEGSTTGGGHYLLQNAFDTQFAFSAVLHGDGSASGNFHQRLESGTGTVDFRGRVTCMAVDAANHRAWVGGVIETNESPTRASSPPSIRSDMTSGSGSSTTGRPRRQQIARHSSASKA